MHEAGEVLYMNEIVKDDYINKSIYDADKQDNIIKTLSVQNKNLKRKINSLEASVRDLNDENQFLADTIINHNMGNIIKERRALFAEMNDIKKQTAIAVQDAENKKKRYEDMSTHIQDLIDDINYKQADIDNYIQSRSQLIIDDLKAELLQNSAKELTEQKQKNDLYIQEIETRLKNKIRLLWMSLGFSIIITVTIIYVFI